MRVKVEVAHGVLLGVVATEWEVPLMAPAEGDTEVVSVAEGVAEAVPPPPPPPPLPPEAVAAPVLD